MILPLDRVPGLVLGVLLAVGLPEPQTSTPVRQLWESSTEGGGAWTVAFDGTYAPKAR